jgi:large subunit ribosomal protein L6
MSRVGKKPIPIPKGVSVTIDAAKIAVKGPKGTLSLDRNDNIDVAQEDGTLVFKPRSETKEARAAYGLMRALCANLVRGVNEGFARELEINGVGYRAEVKGSSVNFQLGYSHPIEFPLPKGVTAKVDKNVIVLNGIDKQLLGAVAAEMRGLRPPEPYKGKGVKYMEERIVRKVGKAASK